jgi:glycosyltransferase involved in cell wall biosynthesis
MSTERIPKISVVIPTFNSAQYLPAAIESVLAQDYKNLEIVVVDDGSSDDTAAVVARFGKFVEYIRLENNGGGPARPRNIGIRAASGDYVALFDSDDLMLPGKLKEQAEFLTEFKDIPLVFTNFRNFSREDEPSLPDFLSDHTDFQVMPKIPLKKNWYRLTSSLAYETLIPDTYIGTSGVMFRKRLIDEAGYFDETISNSDDVEFFFRVSRRFDLGYINHVYHRRRIHAKNISSRPKALDARLRVYSRQIPIQKSGKARRDLGIILSKILFSLGYLERRRGERVNALRYYLRSWSNYKSNPRIWVSVLRLLWEK